MAIELPCDWKSGFVMDPTKKQRCGYLMAFNGLDLKSMQVVFPEKDLAVNDSWSITIAPTATRGPMGRVTEVLGAVVVVVVVVAGAGAGAGAAVSPETLREGSS